MSNPQLGDFTGSDLRSSDQITIGAYAKTKSGGSDYTVLGTCLFNLASIKDNSKVCAQLCLRLTAVHWCSPYGY